MIVKKPGRSNPKADKNQYPTYAVKGDDSQKNQRKSKHPKTSVLSNTTGMEKTKTRSEEDHP